MNLANLTQEEKDKINVDLAASGVAYKERLNMPVVASEVERQQPAHLRGAGKFVYELYFHTTSITSYISCFHCPDQIML